VLVFDAVVGKQLRSTQLATVRGNSVKVQSGPPSIMVWLRYIRTGPSAAADKGFQWLLAETSGWAKACFGGSFSPAVVITIMSVAVPSRRTGGKAGRPGPRR
jgi:hypothetical protein